MGKLCVLTIGIVFLNFQSNAQIIHGNPTNTPSVPDSGESVTIKVEGNLELWYYDQDSRVTLYYRRSGDAVFQNQVMDSISDAGAFYGFAWSSTIDGKFIDGHGLEYYIFKNIYNWKYGWVDPSVRLPLASVDSQGVYSIQVRSLGHGITSVSEFPSGGEENSYRLVSIPIDADNKFPSFILSPVFGIYDPNVWRFFSLNPQGQGLSIYSEYPKDSIMLPGCAFWLISRIAGKHLITGQGVSVATDKEYKIPLFPGWNFIGDPYAFSIPYANMRLFSTKDVQFQKYNGQWGDATGEALEPFSGFAIANSEVIIDTLYVNPQVYSSQMSTPLGHAKPLESSSWKIGIEAKCGSAADLDNVALLSDQASDSVDDVDLPKPPPIGLYISVFFPHPEWNGVFKKYSHDARPKPKDGDIWQFQVQSNMKDIVRLHFTNLETIPPTFRVCLVDESTRETRNLRIDSNYAFANGSEDHPRQLRLIVGTSVYTEEKLKEIETVPSEFALYQNFPNPFNPVTTIRYGLPEAGHVKLTVYNVVGEQVAVLVNEVQDKGYKAVVFDGAQLASGVYWYRLEAGNNIGTMKSILLK